MANYLHTVEHVLAESWQTAHHLHEECSMSTYKGEEFSERLIKQCIAPFRAQIKTRLRQPVGDEQIAHWVDCTLSLGLARDLPRIKSLAEKMEAQRRATRDQEAYDQLMAAQNPQRAMRNNGAWIWRELPINYPERQPAPPPAPEAPPEVADQVAAIVRALRVNMPAVQAPLADEINAIVDEMPAALPDELFEDDEVQF